MRKIKDYGETIKEMSLEELSKLPGYVPCKKCPACNESMSFEMLKGCICINKECKRLYGHTFKSKNAVLGKIKVAKDYIDKKEGKK